MEIGNKQSRAATDDLLCARVPMIIRTIQMKKMQAYMSEEPVAANQQMIRALDVKVYKINPGMPKIAADDRHNNDLHMRILQNRRPYEDFHSIGSFHSRRGGMMAHLQDISNADGFTRLRSPVLNIRLDENCMLIK